MAEPYSLPQSSLVFITSYQKTIIFIITSAIFLKKKKYLSTLQQVQELYFSVLGMFLWGK